MQSIALLWDLEATSLLNSMIEGQMNAILIKVASYGLGKKHLGKSLAELRPHLLKLQEDFGGHCCGEGGEFESLTLDCPLFKKSISL
jgi:diphthine-ammonia ligase